jgi:hypothetical protein
MSRRMRSAVIDMMGGYTWRTSPRSWDEPWNGLWRLASAVGESACTSTNHGVREP